MADSIQIDQLADAVNGIFSEYAEFVHEAIVESVDQTAKDTTQMLKQKSPKRTGKYAKGWTSSKTASSRLTYEKTVHNKKYYRLTHLLEYGHAKVNGGRTAAQPHIAPAEQQAISEFERELKKGIENGAF